MTTFNKTTFSLALALCISSVAEADNIALHKPVTLSPLPNYSLSTDPDDAKQITDGQRASSSTAIWAVKEGVTWSAQRAVFITIDLESIQGIGTVRYSTAARTNANVDWPRELAIYLSDDGKSWLFAGDMVEQAHLAGKQPKPAPEATRHVYESDPIKLAARYVAVVGRGVPFLTVDEVEVSSSAEATPLAAADGPRASSLEKAFLEHLTLNGQRRRLTADRAALQSELDAAGEKELAADLERLPKEEVTLGGVSPAEYRSIFPLNDEHRKLYSLQAKWWQKQGLTSPRIVPVHRYQWLEPIGKPLEGTEEAIALTMLGSDKQASGVLIYNPTQEPLRFEVALSEELQKGGSLYHAPWTDTHEGVAVAAALLPLEEADGKQWLTVPPGLVQKLWFDFESSGVAGQVVEGKIAFRAGEFNKELPVKINVSSINLERTPFFLGAWDYIFGDLYGITPENRKLALDFVRKHDLNICWVPMGRIPFINGQKMPEKSQMEARFKDLAVALHAERPDAERYLLFIHGPAKLDDAEAGTEEFNQQVAIWLEALETGFAAGGIPPEKVAILAIDEPYNAVKADLSLKWSHALNSYTGRKSKIFTDPVWGSWADAQKEYIPHADIISPHLFHLNESGEEAERYFADLAKQGKEYWFYVCTGPVRLADPNGYYRLPGWYISRHGGNGMGYWGLADMGNALSSWNEYTSGNRSFAPIFVGRRSIDNSVQWEALLEGRNDFFLLEMVKAAAEKSPALKSKAEGLWAKVDQEFKRIPRAKGGDRLLDGFWYEKKGANPAGTDHVRAEMIAFLEDAASANKGGWWERLKGFISSRPSQSKR